MAIAALVTLGILGATVMIIFFIAAGSAKKEIDRLAPDYGQRLYYSGADSFFARTPVRFGVLFGEAAPAQVRGWIQPIRLTGAVMFGVLALFLLVLLASAV